MDVRTVIINKLIEALEYEFKRHEPELQALIISELTSFLSKTNEWIETKLQGETPS